MIRDFCTKNGRKPSRGAEEQLKKVFKEVMRSFSVESLSGFRLCIVFTDQYTKFVLVGRHKVMCEALANLKSVFSVVTPMKLWQDNAVLFLSYQFLSYCLDASNLEESQQNGLAERWNRTLLRMARCLLFDSGLHKIMWGPKFFQPTNIRNVV